MIPINHLDGLSKMAVESCPLLHDYVIVSSESELKDMIRLVKGYPLLVTAYPSSEGKDESLDNLSESNLAVFFVLSPLKETFTKAERVNVWQITQSGMQQLKEFLYGQITGQDQPFYPLLWDSRFDGRATDPEYNLQGLTGWSLKFEYHSVGL